MNWEFFEQDHRPFPLPSFPWMATQTWEDVLFVHWRVEPRLLQSLLPQGLTIDCYEGHAWLSLVSYNIANFHFRLLPALPPFRSFPGFNVRTYVTAENVPGIYFFSLDAPYLLAVIGAKFATGLPYRLSKLRYKKEKNSTVHFFSSYKDLRKEEVFEITYKPTPYLYEAPPDSIAYWLLERYRAYSLKKDQLLYVDIHHDQWKLSDVEVKIVKNHLAPFLPKAIFTHEPLVHYARKRNCYFYPPKALHK